MANPSSSQFSRYLRVRRRRKHKKLMLLAAVLLCFAVMLYSLIHLIAYFSNSVATRRANEQLQSIYEEAAQTGDADLPALENSPAPVETPGAVEMPAPMEKRGLLEEYQWLRGDVLPEMYALYSENDDTIAWLKISGVVNLPVVYRDNSYYLNRDFYGKTSPSGTLFLDENTPFAPKTQQLVIHGHNMHDGSMFGQLSHYRRADYARDHAIVYLSTLCRKEVYVVFAVLVVPDSPQKEGFIPYNSYPVFSSAEQCYAYLDLVRSQSLHSIPIDVDASDALLTLSTCLEDDRVVIFCRRLRPDESEASIYTALLQPPAQN